MNESQCAHKKIYYRVDCIRPGLTSRIFPKSDLNPQVRLHTTALNTCTHILV